MPVSGRAYYVERVARTVTTILVHAASCEAAQRLAEAGEGDSIDSISEVTGYRRARRVPEEDRDA